MIDDGQGNGDNKFHTCQHSTGYAVTAIAIYAASYLDGPIRTYGTYIPSALSGTNTWYGYTGATTLNSTTTNVQSTGSDGTDHYAYCPDNTIATGIEIYASGSYLDGYGKIRCTTLNAGYTTTNNGYSVTSGGFEGMSFPYGDQDNIFHNSTCPAGAYARGWRAYAGSQLNYAFRVFCTGIKAP
jgi:hypothetical protein